MRSAERVLIASGTRVADAIAVIDAGQLGLAIVCDGAGRLAGIVTDVDLRKGLLKGMRLDDPVETIMCGQPSVATPETTREELIALMHQTGVRQIPILDAAGRVMGVEILKDLAPAAARDTEVVVMAGGRGHRLRPLTDAIPKPMPPIGGGGGPARPARRASGGAARSGTSGRRRSGARPGRSPCSRRGPRGRSS